MNAPYELARLFKERENTERYTPIFGIVEELPDIKIRIHEKVVIPKPMIASIVDLYQQDQDGVYIYLGKTVYMLPCYQNGKVNRYIILGGDAL